MTGRILIIDAIATNRMVLRAKMLAAQFSVDTCTSCAEAAALIAQRQPDLILVNLSDPTEDRHGFCTQIKADPSTAGMALIGLGIADTARARFAALDAGADDVLVRPLQDALLLARIRSLLRARAVTDELLLRDSTSRALGFCDSQPGFAVPEAVTYLVPQDPPAPHLVAALRDSFGDHLRLGDIGAVLRGQDGAPGQDLFIIPAGDLDRGRAPLFALVADLRARLDTRLAALLVIVPPDAPDMAALLLDLGADDIVPQDALPQETVLRARNLVRRKHLHDRLRRNLRDGLQAAVTDPLTGLFNRRYVDHHLTQMRDQSIAAERKLAVMMIDIDHFKAINDRYGHSAGDRVLVAIARRLRENLRAVDLVARIGGEEFLIAMPRTTAEQAQGAANRLRRLIGDTPFAIGPEHAPVRVTISVGIALSGGAGAEAPDTGDMCDQADAALYRAKSAGRDRVAMHRSAA